MLLASSRFWTLFGVLFLTSLLHAEPYNITQLKQEIRHYHDSGQYEKEIAEVISHASQYLDSQVAENNQRAPKLKLALVLDIDETSLSNYDQIIQRDFIGNLKKIHHDMLLGNDSAITPTLNLYNQALKKGVAVFFVTGRNASEKAATEANLQRVGYRNWKGLYIKPDNYTDKSIIAFKTEVRKKITADGYTIIASIGDQYSDLIGGYTQKEFKLPNPFYYLP